MVKYRLYKILHFLHLISKDKYRKLKAKYTADYLLILKSKYFDKEWYLRTNPDVEEAGIDPIKHYLEHGWKERRNPSILFDGNKYLKEFPDVRNSGINPLLHYEKYGRKENRKLKFGTDRYKLLVHLHLYYHEQINYFLEKFKSLDGYDYDLFITVVENKEETTRKILKFKPDAQIMTVPNKGYDIAPFVFVLNRINLKNYDYIIKVHTKNYRPKLYANHGFLCKGFAWRNALVNALLENKKQVQNNIRLFTLRPKLGMIGNKKLLGNSPSVINEEKRKEICARMGIENKKCMFINGTMFMCRAELMRPLQNLHLTWDDFSTSLRTGDCGTLAHALEDVMAQIVWEQGYTVEGVNCTDSMIRVPGDCKISKTECSFLGIPFFVILLGSEPLNKNIKIHKSNVYWHNIPIGRIKNKRKSPDPLTTIAQSKFFDAEEYLMLHPEVITSGMSPAEHYLKTGWKQGYNPSSLFNAAEYLQINKDVAFAGVNPLLHYEIHGKKEKRLIRVPQKNSDQTTGKTPQNCVDLSICAIIKNEGPYLKEWLDYHLLTGVKRFYLYDNDSDDDTCKILQPYIDKGQVVYHYFPGYGMQKIAYNTCLADHGDETQWLAFIDVDEFIVPLKKKTVPEFLADYKEYSGVIINWMNYDCNNHIKKPKGGVLENYTRVHYENQRPKNHHVKSIVRPHDVMQMLPHIARYKDGKFAVTENKQQMLLQNESLTAFVSVDKIRINHYYCKSKEEADKKVARGDVATAVYTQKPMTQQEFCFDAYKYDYAVFRHLLRLKPELAIKETLRLICLHIKNIFIHLKHYFLRDTLKYYINKKWYYKHYKDAKKSRLSAQNHYLSVGWMLGYNPGPKFNTAFYLKNNPDVAKSKLCPLLHYIHHGRKEGRAPVDKRGNVYKIIAKSKLFDKSWYVKNNKDVDFSKIKPALHYLQTGWKEGRDPSRKFSTQKYLQLNPDVEKAKVNPLLHFEKNGRAECRILPYAGWKYKIAYHIIKMGRNSSLFKRNVILCCDFFFDALAAPIDNFTFFEYVHSLQNPEFEAYYVLNKAYPHYKEIKAKYGKYIIPYKSRNDLHFYMKIGLLGFKMKYVLDSFDAFSHILYKMLLKSKYIESIFTQHGITFFKQTFIKPNVYGQENFDKTTVSNDYEYEIFKTRGGYKKENIIKSGLFRWDLISDTSKQYKEKYIFVYFTYRHYLRKQSDIQNTGYFKNIMSLLNNKELADIMQKRHISFKIALHHDLLKYVKASSCGNIDFVAEEEIGKMKNRASMLITDYSSMCFEFMLQNKPVVFYRFDEAEFNDSENDRINAENLNDLNTYIFNVYNDENKVITALKKYMKNDFAEEKQNTVKANKFFYHKRNICKRFYQYLIRHQEETKE